MTPEDGLALSVAVVLILAAVVLRRRRVVVALFVLLLLADGAVWWVLTPHHYDITWWPRFRPVLQQAWCLHEDYVLVDNPPLLAELEPAMMAKSAGVSVAAAVPHGTPFRVKKVIAEYRPRTRDFILDVVIDVGGRAADGSLMFWDNGMLPGRAHDLVPMKGVSKCRG